VAVALPVKLACTGQIKPRLVVLGYGLVEQRALGAAWVVEFGLGDVNALRRDQGTAPVLIQFLMRFISCVVLLGVVSVAGL